MPHCKARLHHLVDRLHGRRLVVLGDVMLDEYVFGTVSRISPEAPVPVVDVDFEQHTFAPGGATNVAHNLRVLGAEVAILGVVGEDAYAGRLRDHLDGLGVDTSGLVVDPSRPTTLKTRIIAHNQQVVRVDRERRAPLSPAVASDILARIEAHLAAGAEGVLISDYDKGVASGELTARVVERVRARGLSVTANPKPANLERFRGATAITLNQAEAEAAVGRRLPDAEAVRVAGDALRAHLELDALLVTRGSHGMVLIEGGGVCRHIPAAPVDVYDVVGAGDTAFSTLTLALVAGGSLEEAAMLANLAAGAVVRKVGTAVVTPEELRAAVLGEW